MTDDGQDGLQAMQQKIVELGQHVTALEAPLTVHTRAFPNSGEPQPWHFHGRYMEDVGNWLARIQVYFRAHSIPEKQHTVFAAMYLEGKAWDWFVELETINKGPVSWAQFQASIVDRFGAPSFETLLEDQAYIYKIMQRNLKYIRDFQQTVKRLPSIPEHEKILFFISGLKQRTQDHFRGALPNSLKEAYRHAVLYESADSYGVSLGQSASHKSKVDNSSLTYPSERVRRREENRCFRCKQTGHRASKCSKPR